MNARLIVLVIAAFAMLMGALALVGAAPSDAWHAVISGSFGSSKALSGTIKETTPLLIAGLAVYIALRAGLFNIGVEGQLLVGACAAAAIGLAMPNWVGMVLAVLAAMIAGALWAWPAAAIKVYRGGHEVISTIMLNQLALLLTAFVVKGPLQSPNTESPTTADLAPGVRMPWLIQHGSGRDLMQVNLSILIGVVLLLGFGWWLARTLGGFELKATGANPTAAEFAGVKTKSVMLRSMLFSGAIAGLAGACQVLAYEGRFYPNFSPGYGFDALGVALLAGASPYGVIPAAFVFGILAQGNVQLSLVGIPRGISGILLGILIIVFAAFRYRNVRTSNG